MSEQLQETVKKIKQSLRLSMNGVTSTLQRRQGLDYKINFGVEIPRLKSIAQEYPKDKNLATTLWQSNIRECKLLAIFLLPQEHYSYVAEEWIQETPFTEIADHLAMNILCKLPTANALKWIGEEKEMTKYCGYLALTHILRIGGTFTPAEEETFMEQTTRLFAHCDEKRLQRVAFTALCRYIDLNEENAQRILSLAPPKGQLAEMIENYIGV